MTVGATPFSIRRSLNDNPDPHEVVIAPRELHPFAVRFLFRLLEDEEGARCLVMVSTPHLVQRTSPPPELAAVTPELQRTLDENRERYRRMAERYLDVKVDAANEERRVMLEASRASAKPTRAYLVDLANHYQALLVDPPPRGVLEELAGKRHCSVRTIQRHLDRTEAEGLLPAGVRPRRG